MKSVKDKMAPATTLLNPPVIIMGMHRSGTSLLSKMLDKAGIFQGYTQDKYNESLFFQLINENLLNMEETTWDRPEKLRPLNIDSHAKGVLVNYAANIIDEQLLENYWGSAMFDYLKRGLAPPTVAWGWKDPRNTLLLPIWLELFENSRVIHIIRHGVDAAVSLWRRETSRPHDKADPHYSSRCQSLKECFKLWEEYVKMGKKHGSYAKFYIEIHYEDLVANPAETMKQLFTFLQIDLTPESAGIDIDIRSDRRFAYQQDDPSKEFYCWAMKNELLTELYPNVY